MPSHPVSCNTINLDGISDGIGSYHQTDTINAGGDMLSDIQARKAKPQNKPFKLADERGLYLLVNQNGAKLWRMNYRFTGKQKTLALGVYPDVSLSDARTKRDEARQLLAQGVDPCEQRKAVKSATAERAANSFEVIAREWLATKKAKSLPATVLRSTQRLENDLFPYIGNRPIAEIEAPELLEALNRTVDRVAYCIRQNGCLLMPGACFALRF